MPEFGERPPARTVGIDASPVGIDRPIDRSSGRIAPMTVRLRILALLASLAPTAALAEGAALARGAFEGDEHRVEGELVLDVDEAAPGQPFRAGVVFRMAEGWHIYWRHSGEAGLETELRFGGADFSPLRWPFPETFDTAGGFIRTYGYSKEVLLFAEAVAPEGEEELRISATADVLVCKVDCIPALLELERTLPVGVRRPSSAAPLFEAYASRVPQIPEDLRFTLLAQGEGERIEGRLRIEPAGWHAEGVGAFVPDRSPGFETLRGRAEGGILHVEGKASVEAVERPRVRGVGRLVSPEGETRYVEIDAPLEEPPPAAAASASLPWILLLAFGGGALLNLMPCVFPVLAVKVYGFTRMARESRRGIAIHALAYAVGVIGSLLLLALSVIAARAAGMSVGWGFQFQHPIFVALVSAVVVAFALNLFGVYYVGLGSRDLVARVDASRGIVRSVGEGILAVVLATPCSAPLLGTALGFAFAAPAWTIALVFAVLGLGLAAPFCLLVLFPGLTTRLPKPGSWMEHFKQALGFALLGTAAWLVWVMGGLAGVDAMAKLVALLLVVAFACWTFGLAQRAAGFGRWLGGSAAGTALLMAILGGLLPTTTDESAVPSRSVEAGAWSPDAVREALAQGRPVFVDFTADWCLTCKFNERTVLASKRVRSAFQEKGVEVLVADWTRRDEAIRSELARYGKAGVPMYLLYSPQRPREPEVLPELLTEQLVLDSLERLTSSIAKEPNR
jgi:thiol:disulfide interchange protein DsbD